MNKTQTVLLLVGGVALLFFFRKRDLDKEKQLNSSAVGGGGGAVPGPYPGRVVNSTYDAITAGSRAVADFIGLWRRPSIQNPETAYIGSQAPIRAAIPTAPSASAVMISGFDAPASLSSRYANYA